MSRDRTCRFIGVELQKLREAKARLWAESHVKGIGQVAEDTVKSAKQTSFLSAFTN